MHLQPTHSSPRPAMTIRLHTHCKPLMRNLLNFRQHGWFGVTPRAWRGHWLFGIAAGFLLFTRFCQGDTLTVTSGADDGPGSLRAAIAGAVANDTINFAPALSGQTITLTSGQLVVDKNLELIGPGADRLAISGGNRSRVFEILAGTTVSISGLTIRDGMTAATATDSLEDGDDGGGILNRGALSLDACRLRANRTRRGDDSVALYPGNGGRGGAVFNAGSLVLLHSQIVDNATSAGETMTAWVGNGGAGGGIFNDTSATLSLFGCLVAGNRTGRGGLPAGNGGDGGGICSVGTSLVTVTASILSGNTTGDGGDGDPAFSDTPWSSRPAAGSGGDGAAIFATGPVRLEGCTLAHNLTGDGGDGGVTEWSERGGQGGSGGSGGAISTSSNLELVNCTLSGNRTGAGGAGGPGAYSGLFPDRELRGGDGGAGGQGGAIQATGTVLIRNCTVVGNEAAPGGTGGAGEVTGAAGLPGLGGGLAVAGGGTASLVNTLLAENAAPGTAPDVAGTVSSLGCNLVGIADGSTGFGASGDLMGTASSPLVPEIGPLGDNGGPTPTHALLPGSPAVDAGNATLIADLSYDQRGPGFPRQVGVRPDIGALESPPLPPPPPVALNLTVVSGNPIKVNDLNSDALIKTIYDEVLDVDCQATAPGYDFEQYPFSGVANREVILHARLAGCPSGSLVSPTIRVHWSIADTLLEGTEQWTGLEGDLHVTMPDAIGAYTVSFDFAVDGASPKTVTRRLLVTRRTPANLLGPGGTHPAFFPPRISWYERAVEWASGMPASADDATVVTSLLQGLYAFGRTHWRYGWGGGCYGSVFLFQDLLAGTCPVDSAICHDFKNVLLVTAFTLGIDSLVQAAYPGGGLVTVKSASIDPYFPGNAQHRESGTWDRYYFGGHGFTRLGEQYFDPTFGQIYTSADQFVAYRTTGEVAEDEDGVLYKTTLEGARVYSLPYDPPPPWDSGDRQYSWEIKAYVEPPAPAPFRRARSLASPAAFTGFAPSFTGRAIYQSVDADADGLAEQLAAEIEVDLPEAGNYLVTGSLARDGNPVAHLPTFQAVVESRAELPGAVGLNVVTLRFSGEQIFRSNLDGPYALKLVLQGIGPGNHAVTTIETPAFDAEAFGELGAQILSVTDSAFDADLDGGADHLRVVVNLGVRREGTYSLAGNLSKAGHSVVSAGRGQVLTVGSHAVALDFSGQTLARRGVDGPYAGVVSLTDDLGQNLGVIDFTTAAYLASAFSPLIAPTGPWTEEALDDDGNGLINRLRLTQPVSVAEAGDYILSARLSGPGAPKGVYADTRATLAKGAGSVAWQFSGPLIWGQQVDGPYQVDVVVREAATGVERDRLRLSPLTQAYQHTDFDPTTGGAAISLTGRSSNHGVDLNGNGRFDQLRVAVEVAVPGTAVYDWSARLEDAHGTEIGFASAQGTIAQGIGTLEFVFDGQGIGANAVSGPYFVRGLLLFASGQGSLLATDVAATDAYRYTQFEGAPAPGDTDGDGDIDRDDLALVVAGRGTAAQGPDDRRDLDGDGQITALDARKLVVLFTRPGGATR